MSERPLSLDDKIADVYTAILKRIDGKDVEKKVFNDHVIGVVRHSLAGTNGNILFQKLTEIDAAVNACGRSVKDDLYIHVIAWPLVRCGIIPPDGILGSEFATMHWLEVLYHTMRFYASRIKSVSRDVTLTWYDPYRDANAPEHACIKALGDKLREGTAKTSIAVVRGDVGGQGQGNYQDCQEASRQILRSLMQHTRE